MIGDSRKNMQMKVLKVPSDIDNTTASLDTGSVGGHQGVMLCQEMRRADKHAGENFGDSKQYNPDSVEYTWLVLVPKYLSETCGVTGADIPSQETVSPPYKVGEIVYCARLDTPTIMQTSQSGFINTHPSVAAGANWSQIANTLAVKGHYGDGTTINPQTQMIFWIDLNVDGRTRVKVSGGSGTSGTAQNVWL
tara:strand:+ start:218 stop:796 length:579 start_codon:yes stop_codon:yes gene_type:complete